MTEEVNHPERYGGDTTYECIKVLEAWLPPEQYKGFLRGNALKYLCRVGKKDETVQELKKARFYLDKYIEFEEKRKKMENLKVKIKLISGGKLPEYKREGDVCLDCYSRCEKPIEIKPKERALIPLGFALELPEGWEAVIRPRSGMNKSSVDSLIGTIDTNYRGELCAILWNNSGVAISVENETRVCQLAIREVPSVEWEVVDELSETNRGENGFGSSGK